MAEFDRMKRPKETVAARQGTKQKLNLRVLFTSLLLIAVIFAGFYVAFLNAPHSENEPASSGPTQPLPAEPQPQP